MRNGRTHLAEALLAHRAHFRATTPAEIARTVMPEHLGRHCLDASVLFASRSAVCCRQQDWNWMKRTAVCSLAVTSWNEEVQVQAGEVLHIRRTIELRITSPSAVVAAGPSRADLTTWNDQ